MKKALVILVILAMLVTIFPAFTALATPTGIFASNLIVNGDNEAAPVTGLGGLLGTNTRVANTGFGGSWIIRNSNRVNGGSAATWAASMVSVSSIILAGGAGNYKFGQWVKTDCITRDATGTTITTLGTGEQAVSAVVRADAAGYSFLNAGANYKIYGTSAAITSGGGTASIGWQYVSLTMTVTSADITLMTARAGDCYVLLGVDTTGPSFDLQPLPIRQLG